MRTLALIIVSAAGVACGSSPEKFQPGERATARSPEGFSAAQYEIQGHSGALGEVKVWSRGAYRAEVDGAHRTVLHVGFDIDNSSSAQLVLDAGRLSLDSATLNEKMLRDLPPDRVVGEPVVTPHSDQTVHAFFVLPHGVSPQEVDAFRVQWRISGSGAVYSQRTPFLEAEEPTQAGYYYSPFYDPFFYGPYFHHRPRIIVLHHRPFRHRHVVR